MLGLLTSIERDSPITQRKLAGDLGIALGLANSYLRRCMRKGLIKMSQVPLNRYAYYLTPQGFAEKSRLTAEYLVGVVQLFPAGPRRLRRAAAAVQRTRLAAGRAVRGGRARGDRGAERRRGRYRGDLRYRPRGGRPALRRAAGRRRPDRGAARRG